MNHAACVNELRIQSREGFAEGTHIVRPIVHFGGAREEGRLVDGTREPRRYTLELGTPFRGSKPFLSGVAAAPTIRYHRIARSFYQFICPRHFIRVQCRTVIAVYLDQLGIGISGIRGGALLFLQGVSGGTLLFLQGVRGGALLFLKDIRGNAVLLSLSLKCNLLRLSFSYLIF